MNAAHHFTVIDMKVLVTGAAGLVGKHFAQRFSRQYDILALKHPDFDITDQESVSRCLGEAKPSLVINCAVVQVDESEQNPTKAQAVNVKGPRALAQAASRVGAEIIHFSTQYAFDGDRDATSRHGRCWSKRCVKLVLEATLFALRGFTAAIKIVFSAPYTTIFGRESACALLTISGRARRMSKT